MSIGKSLIILQPGTLLMTVYGIQQFGPTKLSPDKTPNVLVDVVCKIWIG